MRATYAALAERLDAVLVTADRGLAGTAASLLRLPVVAITASLPCERGLCRWPPPLRAPGPPTAGSL